MRRTASARSAPQPQPPWRSPSAQGVQHTAVTRVTTATPVLRHVTRRHSSRSQSSQTQAEYPGASWSRSGAEQPTAGGADTASLSSMLSAATEPHRTCADAKVRLTRLQAVHNLVLKRLNNLLAHHLRPSVQDEASHTTGRRPPSVASHRDFNTRSLIIE